MPVVISHICKYQKETGYYSIVCGSQYLLPYTSGEIFLSKCLVQQMQKTAETRYLSLCERATEKKKKLK